MTDFNFDQVIDRRGTDSLKWDRYPEDVLPLWIADMDFVSPPGVIQAMENRVRHGVFGYTHASNHFKEIIKQRMAGLYKWNIQVEWIVFIPGIVTGLNNFCAAFKENHGQVILQTPVYPPILHAPEYSRHNRVDSPLIRNDQGQYEMDWSDFEKQASNFPSQYILCNPQNPSGRVFTESELTKLAEICLRHDVLTCSDEIHCDLVYPSHKHIPFATLSSEVAEKTITFMAPSKTFNIAGLNCSFAIIPNQELRRMFTYQSEAFSGYVNLMGLTAGMAAYETGEAWLCEVLGYLQGNRDQLANFVNEKFRGVKYSAPEGTYLAWMDFTDYNLGPDPAAFFLNHAKVGLNSGQDFGEDGIGFVRLNFACPRMVLVQALERMETALKRADKL